MEKKKSGGRVGAVAIKVAVLCLALFAYGCDMMEYTRYDIDFDSKDKDQIEKNLKKLAETPGSEEAGAFSFAFMTDSQNFFDRLTEGVEHVNRRDDFEFVLVGGDICEYGLPSEYELGIDNFKDLKKPFLHTIGNHDALGVGVEAYREMYGAFDYTFIYKRVKFVSINTNSREFRKFMKVPDVDWLEQQLKKTDEHDYTIVVCHTGFYPDDDSFDQSLYPQIDSLLSNTKDLVAVIHGHGHSSGTSYPLTNNMIPMIEVGPVCKRFYSVFHFDEGSLREEVINYD
ncbi:hypothetical protein FUAX_11230 [Fulvitalea axinellae]|uniref:Calcineurin-like phosphoesterase domain-containing protein n=1 Tax=Fulvitalea axinellae TaxID=1182444 RepID=A0AAU9C982_9BACT|nr:hypothetical protein FUAX_11230 [Fulvitalea axinellae]